VTPRRAATSAALVLALLLTCAVALATPGRSAALTTADTTPFPASKVIVGARWTSARYGPPANQWGDILPTVWADDGNTYVIMDDGGTDVPVPGALWRASVARITGTPPHLRFTHVGNPYTPPPHTWAEIGRDGSVHHGPLGPYYSTGMLAVDHVFYATQLNDWNWSANGQFTGLAGIAYSTDRGQRWNSVGKPFPSRLGNLSWVIRGRDGAHPDGYVYAIASEREFNASNVIIGRSAPGIAHVTDPAQWQWLSGWTQSPAAAYPTWSAATASAVPIMSWGSHVTYPQMSYDAPLHRYLLTFTFSYGLSTPALWRDGAELVIMESPHPWGPFSFVARERWFGPSNGYAPGFPVKWISVDGRDLWLKWAANFAGCAPALDCDGGYGFNYRRLHLTLAGDRR
jgi:hypothetical protein